ADTATVRELTFHAQLGPVAVLLSPGVERRLRAFSVQPWSRRSSMVHSTEVLLDGLAFPEGPRWHDGRLFFSDMHGQRVVAVHEQGESETIASVPNQPSGLGWLPDGRMLVVSMVDRQVLRLDDGALVLHADLAALAPSNCNDMVVGADGRAYVGNFGFDM